MGLFRDLINEARNTSVPTEYRIALGQLKRMYNAGEVPSEKELQKDAEMIAKKNHLEEDKFFEFAKSQFKINEAKITKSDSGEFTLKDGIIQITKKELNKIHKDYKSDKTLLTMINGRTVSVPFVITEATAPVQEILAEAKSKEDLVKYYEKNLKNVEKEYSTDSRKQEYIDYAKGQLAAVKKDGNAGLIKFLKDWNMNEAKSLNVGDTVNLDVYSIENSEYVNQFPGKKVPCSVKIISPKINVNGDFTFEVPKYKGKEAILPKKFILESAVGTPGRTTVKDAEEHINDELIAEFKKIIKKLGGKTVAKVLLDKLGQKAEIKDEIEHIEDIIDNSNY